MGMKTASLPACEVEVLPQPNPLPAFAVEVVECDGCDLVIPEELAFTCADGIAETLRFCEGCYDPHADECAACRNGETDTNDYDRDR